MTEHCKHDGCYPDTTCALGHIDRTKCKYWSAEQEKALEPGAESDTSDIPWNIYALGTDDLLILAGRGRPIVVGLIGAPSSGKTSLLAFLYMWFLEHGEVADWAFCGSWTLGGWEAIVQNCRWFGEPPPSFPPHTTSRGRVPSLLHLSLRNKRGFFRDILFTDVPGEWFTHWAKTPTGKSAAGARWVIKHSDVLMLLADQDALANYETLPQARRDTRDLTERVGAVASHIPLGFTWTKIDIKLSSDTRDMLDRSRVQFASHSEVWETTITKPETIAKTLFCAIDRGEKQQGTKRFYEPISKHEPFLAFRGYNVCS